MCYSDMRDVKYSDLISVARKNGMFICLENLSNQITLSKEMIDHSITLAFQTGQNDTLHMVMQRVIVGIPALIEQR
jgi:hypothetical protein